jgi:hypothetical protein
MLAFGLGNPNDWFCLGVKFLSALLFLVFCCMVFLYVCLLVGFEKRNIISILVYEMLNDVQIQGLIGATREGLRV